MSLSLIKRETLSTSLTAFGTRHSISSSCLKTIVISWLWGSATAQGCDQSIHTSSQGLYMSIVHSLDEMHCLTHPYWSTPDRLPRKVYESLKQWEPSRGACVYFRISAIKQMNFFRRRVLLRSEFKLVLKCLYLYIYKSFICIRINWLVH